MYRRHTRNPEVSAFHFLNGQAGAGVLVMAKRTRHFLLGKRGYNGESPGLWAPFGGMVEPGETPDQAAARELEEEAGFTVSRGVMHPLYSTMPSTVGFVFHTFLAVVPDEPVVSINSESSGYGWFDLFTADGTLKPPSDSHLGFYELLQDEGALALIRAAWSFN